MNTRLYLTAYRTIVAKEIARFLRIWPQTILPPAMTMSLYFIIFGNLIGPRIGTMGGYTYMEYIAPGIIMMSIITNSYANVVSSFFSSKFQKNIEEMLVAPIPNIVIIGGYMTGGVARGLTVGTVVTVVALFFTNLSVHHFGIMLLVILLTSMLFALGGFINAIFANKFDDISIVPTFVLTPLTYLGGVFYSIDLLPGIWQKISLFNPILYMVNTFRYSILGVSDIDLLPAFVVMILFVCVLFGFCLHLMNKGHGIRA